MLITHKLRCTGMSSLSKGGGGFVIEVSNPGDDISPEHLPRILGRFYRVDISRGKSQSSFGLGLAFVKSIMTLYNGDVHVESVPNGFTTFRLIFPTGRAHRPRYRHAPRRFHAERALL
ncbi:MAG: ATP-binding protein [Burkholderiales bacterium]|nr:ATP-binding protein [Burkholderiales bacterium]